MSGTLSTISSIVGKVSVVRNSLSILFGGSGGVSLGGVNFAGTEVPETIKWGGRQDIVKQRLPGGVVVMSAMGIEYTPISWSGIFEGISAIGRSRQLYAMMNAALTVSLAWNDRNYTVMIDTYSADDTKENWIPYTVTVCILRDETLVSSASSPGLLSQITSDIAGAIGITPDALVSGVGTALQVASVAATVVGAVTGGSAASGVLASALGAAQLATGAAISVANSQVGGIIAGALSTGSLVFPAGSAASGIANFGTALASSANLSALPVIGGLIGRSQINLANAST